MSGRKSWEVAEILSESDNVQKRIIDASNKKIGNYFDEIEKLNVEIKNFQNMIDSSVLKVDLAKKEFGEEIDNLQKRFDYLKRKRLQKNHFEELRNKRDFILKELEQENKKAAKIREKIKNTSHYVTAEYNEAVKIRNIINNLKDEFAELEKETKYELDIFKANLNKIKAIYVEICSILENVNRLERKAKEIDEIRKEIQSMKEEIKIEFALLDEDMANKFLKNEYRKLELEVSHILKESDFNYVRNRFDALSREILLFKTKLNEVYNEYINKKQNLEDSLKSLEKLNVKELILIEDFLARKDTKVSKLYYYDHYNQTNYEEKFENLLSEIKELIQEEEFTKANKKVKEANDLYFNISKATDRLQESIETTLFLTIKIRDIMLDKIDFRKAKIEWVDEYNHKSGFKMTCENGDTIVFEKIIVENGKPVIKINHIEKTPGTCNIRWRDLRDVFANEGIPLVDVTKDGRSVIYGGAREKISESNKQKGKAR